MTRPAEKPAHGELLAAVQRKDPQAVSDLLERGSNVNEIDGDGETPLMRAMIISRDDGRIPEMLQIVDLLVNWGADPHKKDVFGCSALSLLDTYHLEFGTWPDPASFRQVQIMLAEAPERHYWFIERRTREKAALAARLEAERAAALATRNAEQDKKIDEMQKRLNNKSAVKIKPGRRMKAGGP